MFMIASSIFSCASACLPIISMRCRSFSSSFCLSSAFLSSLTLIYSNLLADLLGVVRSKRLLLAGGGIGVAGISGVLGVNDDGVAAM